MSASWRTMVLEHARECVKEWANDEMKRTANDPRDLFWIDRLVQDIVESMPSPDCADR